MWSFTYCMLIWLLLLQPSSVFLAGPKVAPNTQTKSPKQPDTSVRQSVNTMRSDFCNNPTEQANLYLGLSMLRQRAPLGFRFYQLVYEQQKSSGLLNREQVRPNLSRRKGKRELNPDAFLLQKMKILHLREPAPFLNEQGQWIGDAKLLGWMIDRVKADHKLHVEFFKCGSRHCWQDMNRFLADWPNEAEEVKLRDCAARTCQIDFQLKTLCTLARPQQDQQRLCFIHSCLINFIQSMRNSKTLNHVIRCMKKKPQCKEWADQIKKSFSDFIKEASKIKLQTLPERPQPSPVVPGANLNPKNAGKLPKPADHSKKPKKP